MFTKAANFSNLIEEGEMTVSNIWHKAYIDIDEKGTVAGSVVGN